MTEYIHVCIRVAKGVSSNDMQNWRRKQKKLEVGQMEEEFN